MEPARITAAEMRVMHAVWRRGPAGAREIAEAVSGEGWSYATIRTLIRRLVGRGALRPDSFNRKGHGRPVRYYPVLRRTDHLAALAAEFLADHFNGRLFEMLMLLHARDQLPLDDLRSLRRHLVVTVPPE